MKHCVLLAMLGAVACGSSDAPTPGVDFTCHQSDRTGTYLSHFTERSGDCGPIPDVVGRIDGPLIGGTCTNPAPDRWSDGDCKLERTLHCVANDGSIIDGQGVTTQQTPDGSHITGVFTATIAQPGQPVCTSTYDLDQTRQ